MALRAMFSQIKGDDILTALDLSKNIDPKHLDAECLESKIVKLLLREDSNSYSIDQLSMISQLVTQKWMMPDNDCLSLHFHEGDTVFNMLLHFSAMTLMVKDGDPVFGIVRC